MSGFATYPSLRDRVVVVTGGASGIGESMVRAFVEQGARVAFLDLDDAAGKALQGELGHGTAFYACDVTSIPALQAVFGEILGRFGAVDVLVNNAANDTRHKTEDVTEEFWDRGIAVNLRHQFFAMQAVLPGMKAAGRGAIINMSSISWMIPSTGLPVYVASKAAIAGLSRTIAREVGEFGIRVNCVLPGAVATERQKKLWYTEEYKAEILARQALKRMIEPEEVARLVLFLAADDSAAITNQSYVIDAGWM